MDNLKVTKEEHKAIKTLKCAKSILVEKIKLELERFEYEYTVDIKNIEIVKMLGTEIRQGKGEASQKTKYYFDVKIELDI